MLLSSIALKSIVHFIKFPKARTMARWADEVPENFRFTFKLYREITHSKTLDFHEGFVTDFFQAIDAVHPKEGCVLIQFPPSIGIAYQLKMERLLEFINTHHTGWKLAVEFRNKSWYITSIYDVLNHGKAALVIHDIPKSATPLIDHELDFVYVRFHGPTGNYRDSYANEFLREYALYVREWVAEGKTVYLYFNNTMGDAFQNLSTINQMLLDDLLSSR
jgi:uncharacterized protein YecE (DUF72 family)